jgi:hypothetical protein
MYSVPMFNQKSGPTRGPTSGPTRVSTLDINNTKKNTADIFTGASTSLYGYLGVNLVITLQNASGSSNFSAAVSANIIET